MPENNTYNHGDKTNPPEKLTEKENLIALQDLKAREAAIEEKEPFDKWNVVYIILLLHGIATLMPWNMFITANSYFVHYKLAGNGTDVVYLRSYFLSFLGFTAQVPNVILNGLNVFLQCGGGGNITKRIVWSIIVVILMFIATVVMAMLDSSAWPAEFFWITMGTVVVINMANGVYQNSVYGTAACLPMKYTNAVILGSNISGTIATVLSILSMASAPNPRTAAIYYFLTAIFILLIAFDTYFLLPLMKFYRFYQNRANSAPPEITANADVEVTSGRPPFLYIFKKCWVHHLSVFFVFFVTLTCFPAIQAGIEPSGSPGFIISRKYYTSITCFLVFNVFAVVGNIVSEFTKWPGKRWVWLPVVLRGMFIPFFMFCNFKPSTRSIPILFNNDYVYTIGGILMAFTSGYFSSLTMMFSPSNVEPKHQGTAGMMAAFFLIFGIFAGVTFSLPVTLFIEQIGGQRAPIVATTLAPYVNATIGT